MPTGEPKNRDTPPWLGGVGGNSGATCVDGSAVIGAPVGDGTVIGSPVAELTGTRAVMYVSGYRFVALTFRLARKSPRYVLATGTRIAEYPLATGMPVYTEGLS